MGREILDGEDNYLFLEVLEGEFGVKRIGMIEKNLFASLTTMYSPFFITPYNTIPFTTR